MNESTLSINPSLIPNQLDAVHLGLAALSLLLLLLCLVFALRKPKAAAQAEPEHEAKASESLKQTDPDSALQLLALLQQHGRLVDFLQEDISAYSDADIGAAARVVHQGGAKTLQDYFTLEPIRTENEESRLTIKAGFNANEIRLTGNLVGDAPYQGTLIHRGWRAAQVNLPKLADAYDSRIIAAAEVEL